MDKFRKRLISSTELLQDEKAISVGGVLESIQNHKYYEQFVQYLNALELKNEIIEISGIHFLLKKLALLKFEFIKFDLKSDFKDLSFEYMPIDGRISINFSNVERVHFVDSTQKFDLGPFTAIPINSAQSEFFASVYNMEKYAKTLLQSGHEDIVLQNLEFVKASLVEGGHDKSYRLIMDTEGIYLRAITSTNKYYDYNIDISVALILITLHKNSETKNSYSLTRCEYNQSMVKAFFKKSLIIELGGIGKIQFLIELANDEIKREALKLNLGFSIIFKDEDGDENELYIQPQEYKSNILSIPHGSGPEKAVRLLDDIKNLVEIEKDLLEEVMIIKAIKKPDQIKHLLKTKVEKLKANALVQHKTQILSLLERNVNSIHELLSLMHKVDLIAEDIDSKEYLRYLLYEVLTSKNKI